MPAPFILELGPDIIRLLKRTGLESTPVGAVETQSADLTPRLRKLVDGLDEDSTQAELILPEAQILYTLVAAPGPDDLAREIQVRAALDGMTPYSVDEISFDWERSDDPDMVRVAAVAFETLDEAARFAAAHGIEAAAFGAHPDPAEFPRNPVFHTPSGVQSPVVDSTGADQPDPDPADPEDTAPDPTDADLPDDAADADIAEQTEGFPPEDNTEVLTEPDNTPDIPPQPDQTEVTAFSSQRDDSDDGYDGTSETLAATSPRISPDVAGTPDLSVTSPDLPETGETAEDPPATITTGSGFTADGVPDHGRAAASLTPPVHQDTPAAAPAEPRFTVADVARPVDPASKPNRRLAIAAALAALAIAGGWVLIETFTPPNDTPRVVVAAPDAPSLPETPGADPIIPDADRTTAATDAPEIFEPTVEEMAETQAEALLPGDTAMVPTDGEATAEDVAPISETPLIAGADGWQRPPDAPVPPRTLGDSDVDLAAIDTATPSTDAIALAPVNIIPVLPTVDTAPPAVSPDESPDGALPVETPVAEAPPPGEESTTPPGGVALNLTNDLTEPQPTELAQLLTAETRPRARPAALVEANERARFNGRTLAELATLQPRARPPSPQADPSIDATPTDAAVARLVMPQSRPDNMAELVAAARASAAQPEAAAAASTAGVTTTASAPATAPATAPAAPAATTPSPQPQIPTRAEVAREATIDNAVRLSRINLIGVYGSDANRRALVRLPSGRYVKVKVGDRFDGGQVAAIGDSDLRYVKGGRNITLTVPSG